MDILKKAWPQAYKAKDVGSLIVALIIYVLIDIVCGALIGILAKIPVVNLLCGLLGGIVGLYALVGIILTILVFLKILK